MDQPKTTSGANGSKRRAGLKRFAPGDAPLLQHAGVMTRPEMHPPAPDQMMEWATGGGQVVKVLFGDPEAGGMSLVWSWFAPGYMLPRHSHSADCLYYVTKGELKMGKQVLRESEGFFVPADAPYAYTAGPEGVEVLEFRGQSTFDMQISESLGRWSQIVETVRANREQWAAETPAHA